MNRVGRCSTPSVFPSINEIVAKPNMTLAKKAPNRRILVICQITNCGAEILYSLKVWMRLSRSCLPPLAMNPITVFIAYQKMDDLVAMLTLTRATADRAIVETSV